MKGLVFLTGEASDLALAELKGALVSMGASTKIEKRQGRIILLDGRPPTGLAPRLGYSHFAGILNEIVPVKIEAILKGVQSALSGIGKQDSISWQSVGPRKMKRFTSSELFEAVDRKIRDLGFRVKYRDPDIKLFLIISGECFIGRIIEISDRASVAGRKGSRMPFNRPIVMDPRLARVLVNLSGLPPGSIVLDPFLGPAGLAIEAAHLGLYVTGIETNRGIFEGARVNILHSGMEDRITVFHGDSRDLKTYPWYNKLRRIDGIITDPPFGRSAFTDGEEPGKLLWDVLAEVTDLLDPGTPMVVDFHSSEHITDIPGFDLEELFSLRIHRSMTRHIAVLRKV